MYICKEIKLYLRNEGRDKIRSDRSLGGFQKVFHRGLWKNGGFQHAFPQFFAPDVQILLFFKGKGGGVVKIAKNFSKTRSKTFFLHRPQKHQYSANFKRKKRERNNIGKVGKRA